MENNIELMKKLYLEREQYKAIAAKQDELLKESVAMLETLRKDNIALKARMELALSMIKELTAEKRPEIDFPNSMKGGKGETGTPLNFPDDSNLF